MSTEYKYRPRRASKRWLDGDCPAGVLAIFDHPRELDRYTIFYTDVTVTPNGEEWLTYLGTSEHPGHFGGHGELRAYQVRAYRDRNHHRAARWSDLPDAVKAAVRRDLGEETDR